MLATSLVLIGVAAGVYIARHAPAGGMLIVLSDPAGVDVIVDGKATGEQTPASLRGLGPGEHTVRLRHPSFDELERVVRLEDGGRAVVDVHLEPRSRTVEVSTVPPGAIVFRDGEHHALRIEKAGYETATKRISPDDANQLAPFVLEVEREPRGTIFVDAGGPAAVWIDGQYSGFMTPTPGLRVSAGEHEVQLRDGGGKVLDHARVKVDEGATARISLLLEPVARTVAK